MHPAGFFRRDGLKGHARAVQSPAQRAVTQWRTPLGVGCASTCGRLKHHRGRKKLSTEVLHSFFIGAAVRTDARGGIASIAPGRCAGVLPDRARRIASRRPGRPRTGPARTRAVSHRRVRTDCARARAAPCRTSGTAPARGARKCDDGSAPVQWRAPSRDSCSAASRRRAVSRGGRGRRFSSYRCRARTGCARARAAPGRILGTGLGPDARRSFAGTVRGRVAGQFADPYTPQARPAYRRRISPLASERKRSTT